MVIAGAFIFSLRPHAFVQSKCFGEVEGFAQPWEGERARGSNGEPLGSPFLVARANFRR
jgi:hypothetical protein